MVESILARFVLKFVVFVVTFIWCCDRLRVFFRLQFCFWIDGFLTIRFKTMI